MPLLTEKEIYKLADDGVFLGNVKEITRAIEAKVIEKIKAQGPAAWRFDISEDCYNKKWGLTESGGLAKSGDPRAQPLYPLPEGD